MSHDPSNRNCDLTQYGGADGVRCTCEFDLPEDAPQPSVVMPPNLATPPGNIVLTGRKAQTYSELEHAVRELHAARALLAPAEARWKAALEAHAAEMLR